MPNSVQQLCHLNCEPTVIVLDVDQELTPTNPGAVGERYSVWVQGIGWKAAVEGRQ